MTPVPWFSLDPNLCERIVSVLLLQQRPLGTRRRAAQGDHGIDVIAPTDETKSEFDIYQIKYFYSSLNSSQRRQIAASVGELIKYVRTSGTKVRNWHLAMPLDPTAGDEEWLNNLFEGTGIQAFWNGESHLNGWSANFPAVIDYYLGDGRTNVERLFERALSLVEFHRDRTSGVPLDFQVATETLSTIFEQLNSKDPHYLYEFHVVTRGRDLEDLPDGIALRHVQASGNHQIIIDAFPRHSEADSERPIEGVINVTAPNSDASFIEAMERFRKYGEDIRIPGEYVEALVDDPISGLRHFGGSGEFSFVAASAALEPVRLRLIARGGDGEKIASAPVSVARSSAGMLGGYSTVLESDSGVFTLTTRGEPDDEKAPTMFNISATWSDKIAAKSLDDVRFISAIKPGSTVYLAKEFGGAEHALFEVGDRTLCPEWLLLFCESLSNLQEFADSELRMLVPDDHSPRYVNQAINADKFRRGEALSMAKGYIFIEVDDPDDVERDINEAGMFANLQHYSAKVANVNVTFDDAIYFATGVQANKVDADGKVGVVLAASDGGKMTLQLQRERAFLETYEGRC